MDLADAKNVSLLPDRLRHLREKRGLKQRELARLCAIGENQINKYENGGGDPSATNLKRIAEVLEVSADYLLGLSDDPRRMLHEGLTSDEQRFLAAYVIGDAVAIMELASARLRTLIEEADK